MRAWHKHLAGFRGGVKTTCLSPCNMEHHDTLNSEDLQLLNDDNWLNDSVSLMPMCTNSQMYKNTKIEMV